MRKICIVTHYIIILFLVACSTGTTSLRSALGEKIDYNLREGVEAFGKGEYNRAKNFFGEALQQAVKIDDLDNTTSALLGMAEVNLMLALPSEAYENITHADLLTTHEGFTVYQGKIRIAYARYYEYLKQNEKALEAYTSVVNSSGTKEDKGIAYNNMARIYLKQKQYDRAETYFLKAQDIHESLALPDKLADNKYNLGRLFYLRKNYKKAETYFLQALALDKETGSAFDILKDLKMIGLVYQKQGDRDNAYYYFYRALQLAKLINKTQMAYFSGKIMELKSSP